MHASSSNLCLSHFRLPDLATQGSLHDYIQSSSAVIRPATIIDSSLQIINGLVYLISGGFQPLLSSPNVMVSQVNGNQQILKITDYTSSLLRPFSNVVDKSPRSGLWMAPETLRKQRLSAKAEVWSFGVVGLEPVSSHTETRET